MTEELKPCPFCGGRAFMLKKELPQDHPITHLSYIQCMDLDCSIKTPEHIWDDIIVRAWNKRTEQK